MIDQTTAEVVHIDFGIAFEQGKTLPIPEPIPFRLTRDMVAAMGVAGVEGVMRRCCEETMTVLRDRREMIITLLQVLIYDPLFSWSISPYKAYKMQSEDSIRFTESGDQGQYNFFVHFVVNFDRFFFRCQTHEQNGGEGATED